MTVPPITGDQKKDICARLQRLGEDAKIAVRNIRKHQKQEWTRAKLNKAEMGSLEKRLQALTDEAIDLIDEIICDKIKSIS